MGRWGTVVGLLLVGATAQAKVAVYTARPGDSPESVAADWYGNRALASFIVETNGLKDGKLRPGIKVRIPTAFIYKIRRGDTLEALASRFLDDKRRATFLAGFSGIKITDKLREGQDLLVPFQHVHRAEAPESLQMVARQFYGDQSKARLLGEYNFRQAPLLAKGEKILVPIVHVRIRAVHLDPKAPVAKPAPLKEAAAREAELAARVGEQLQVAEGKYKDGSYEAVPAGLDKLLTEEDPSEAQLAEIFRLKAFSYVALGMEELAVNAFREVIARKPDAVFDEATVSPKIRSVFERAKKTPAP
jgi:hypothetical protein